MANIRSSAKRARQNGKRRDRNRYYRSTARTHIKTARAELDAGDLESAEASILAAIKSLDRAAQKGVIHPNNAARRKSRLVKSLNKAKALAA